MSGATTVAALDPELADRVEAAIWRRNAKRKGREVYFTCPNRQSHRHSDADPSARWEPVKRTWYCDICRQGGGLLDLAGRLGLATNQHYEAQRAESRIVATYPYRNEGGELLFEEVRYDPKDFRQRRPDGFGGWLWDIKGIRRVPYRLPELMAADPAERVYVPEGPKDVDRLRSLGLVASTNPMGAGKWLDEFTPFFQGRAVIILPDNDDAGRKHAQQVARSLSGTARSVKVVELPELADKGDVSDWLSAGHTAAELGALAEQTAEWRSGPRYTLPETLAVFKRRLYMPDTGAVEIALAAIAANWFDGDPVWLVIVAPPGFGKTEVVNSIAALPNVRLAAVLNEASLLSGTPSKDCVKGSRGGLLREIGDFGVLAIKDFGAVLASKNDTRGPLLQALRDIYDGRWVRNIGSDGGRTLEWHGKLGLIAGSTPSIDAHHSVMATLGERFAFYRIGAMDEQQLAEKAADDAGDESEMRKELADAVAGLFAGLTIPDRLPALAEAERAKLTALGRLAVRCRSAVERDMFSASREIVLIPGAEAPTRFVKVLRTLLGGLLAIGCTRERAWVLIEKVALDSIPKLRREVLDVLMSGHQMSTAAIATRLNYATNTARRAVEELACYGLVHRVSARSSQEGPGHPPDMWNVTDWTRDMYAAAKAELNHVILTDGISDINKEDSVSVRVS